MEEDPKAAVQGMDPGELDQVAEHLDDPAPPAAKPGGPLRFARMTGSSIAGRDHVEQSYRRAGRAAQHEFWGQGGVERLSMLHQLALQIQ